MTIVECCVIACAACLFIMMITMFFVVSKLDDICWKVMFMRSDVDNIERNTTNVRCDVESIMSYVDRIREEVCPCEDEEDDDLCGMNADVVVVDELVGEEDEDELDIHLITSEEYHFANGYSKNELHYHPNTDQVKYFSDSCCAWCSMENITEYIGDALVFFGMNVQEPNVVYVRNHILDADFRIEKVGVKRDE